MDFNHRYYSVLIEDILTQPRLARKNIGHLDLEIEIRTSTNSKVFHHQDTVLEVKMMENLDIHVVAKVSGSAGCEFRPEFILAK